MGWEEQEAKNDIKALAATSPILATAVANANERSSNTACNRNAYDAWLTS